MTTKYGRPSQKPALAPIQESDELTNNQIVPMAYDHQKKQRNMLIKQKATNWSKNFGPKAGTTSQAYGVGPGGNLTGTNEYAQDAGADTFLTGGGMPGERTKKNKDIKEDFR
jgi:hypothetical protein